MDKYKYKYNMHLTLAYDEEEYGITSTEMMAIRTEDPSGEEDRSSALLLTL